LKLADQVFPVIPTKVGIHEPVGDSCFRRNDSRFQKLHPNLNIEYNPEEKFRRTVMAFMKWDEKYSVDIKIIDEQHKRLFELIENFYGALRQKHVKHGMSEILQGLTDYSIYHFHSEETMMTLHNYPGYQQHKSEHERFIHTVEKFRTRFEKGQLLLPIEVADFLKNWLSNHILATDKQFAPFFHRKGIQ
jgi:hemerythrin-like metal-binding protein